MKKHYKLLLKHISFLILFLIISDFFLDENSEPSIKLYLKEYPLLYSILIVFIAPFFEELIFRYPLKYHYFNILISPIIALIFFNTDILFVKISCACFIISLIIQRFLYKGDKSIYITSIICFTAIHLDNYDLLQHNLFYNIILVFPQFILAIILTMIRINYSTKDSIIYHSIYNLILLVVASIALFYE